MKSYTCKHLHPSDPPRPYTCTQTHTLTRDLCTWSPLMCSVMPPCICASLPINTQISSRPTSVRRSEPDDLPRQTIVTRSNLTAIRDSINWVGWPPRIRRLLFLLSQRCGISEVFLRKTKDQEVANFENSPTIIYAHFQNSPTPCLRAYKELFCILHQTCWRWMCECV